MSGFANASLLSNINFTGVGGRLVVTGAANVPVLSAIDGFDANDVVTFENVTQATAARYSGGQIQLLNDTTVVGSVGVNAGFAEGSALGFQRAADGGINVGVGLGNGGGLPNDVLRGGLHTEYLIASTSLGSLYLQDTVRGRDSSITLSDAKYILFADGIGRFDASGAAMDVARIYRAALDRQADAPGLEAHVASIEGGLSSEAQIATNFTQSQEFIGTYGNTSDAQYVNLLYQNTLDRTASNAEISFQTSALMNGLSRGQLLLNFAESFEFVTKNLGATGDTVYGQIYRLYGAALDRTPDNIGLPFWFNLRQGGESLESIALKFIESNEFQSLYGNTDNTQFATLLYQNALNREPDTIGLQTQVSALDSGLSREQLLVNFSESLENRINTAAATHDNWVFLGNA
ncbi:DUF4214 domain-containing protein [Belnapia sp. T18]|uniref:DUF4214 domain-containing protein n=1 Tax=Belnapia arida TaxID=2804533 RepID=A0ABS1TZ81_9PROT|nr:DUF4214 domain-containing protein [Belnapia arida]